MTPLPERARLEQEVGRVHGELPVDLKLEVRDGVAVEVAVDEGVAAALFIAQLPGDAGERVQADEREILVAGGSARRRPRP